MAVLYEELWILCPFILALGNVFLGALALIIACTILGYPEV